MIITITDDQGVNIQYTDITLVKPDTKDLRVEGLEFIGPGDKDGLIYGKKIESTGKERASV